MADESEIKESGPSPRTVALGVLVLALVIFVLSNLDETPVQFLGFDVEVSLALALGVSAAIGLAVGYIGGRQAGNRRRRRG